MAVKVEKLASESSIENSANESEMPHLESTSTYADFESRPKSFPRYADYDKIQGKMT